MHDGEIEFEVCEVAGPLLLSLSFGQIELLSKFHCLNFKPILVMGEQKQF